ncbi:MAG TPA: efflux RND transporter periplasmic adaptor subunit, partial [Gemmatimonadaceae bacterium]|nr:efflux RND transporter periplasmic adaptor subunit [Gemmatimonadaceae bacterium]
AAAQPAGVAYVVRDTTITATQEATAVAEPFAQATLSTKLMGTVTAVLVREGDKVAAGQPLVRIDARDLDAKRQQVQAGIASAEAMYREAELMATRMRALFADSAAPKAQLDAAEAGLARARAGVSAARAGESEIDAVAGYSVIRAPFTGTVTQRFVDPGAFAAPGAPLVTVQDHRTLRVAATVAPDVAAGVRRGSVVPVTVEGVAAEARVEGIVPAPGGSLYTINAIVPNRDGTLLAGGASRLMVGTGTRQALLVPARALRREGDLVGVLVSSGGVTTTRWLRTGTLVGDHVEVLAGLAAGDTVRVPNAGAGDAASKDGNASVKE